jgi:deoxyadenosine/deoxycytidine kinase
MSKIQKKDTGMAAVSAIGHISSPTADATKSAKQWCELAGLCIEVEGNIGSGKSTLTKKIKNFVNESHPESSEVFAETVNNSFLGAFYGDTKRFSFAFQMYMLTTRIYQMEEAARQAKEENRLVFLDRGAVGDTLFALLNFKSGNMKPDEMEIYKSVCRERFPSTLSEKVDLVLYLDVDPRECHRRVTSLRKNDAEDGIPLEYLEGVDSTYFHLFMDWLGARKGGFHDMNIGSSPPLCVLRWDNYDETALALQELVKLKRGARRSPTVKFQLEKPANVPTLNTKEEVEGAYDRLLTTSTPALDKENTQIAVNWDLQHNNSFRRVIMGYLALQGDVILYGASTQQHTVFEQDQ